MEGDDGGYPGKKERGGAVASVSCPANTVAILTGLIAFCKARRTAGRMRPAAHPQIEFTTTIVVPDSFCTKRSTSAALRSSSIPRRVSSSRIGITIISGYMDSPVFIQLRFEMEPRSQYAFPRLP